MSKKRVLLAVFATIVIWLAATAVSAKIDCVCPAGWHIVWNNGVPHCERNPRKPGPPRPKPSGTPKPSPTPKCSECQHTPTATATASPTSSVTPTASSTPSATPTGDNTPTVTPTSTPSKTPTQEPTPCPKGCVAVDPLALQCVTHLATGIKHLFDGKRELYEGSDWSQLLEGTKITLTVYDGHLRNSMLDAVLMDGEKLQIQMQVGLYVVITDPSGNWYQQNCYRIAHGDTGPKKDVDVRFSQVDVVAIVPCPKQ